MADLAGDGLPTPPTLGCTGSATRNSHGEAGAEATPWPDLPDTTAGRTILDHPRHADELVWALDSARSSRS